MKQPPWGFNSHSDAYRAIVQRLISLERAVARLSEKRGPGDPAAPPPNGVMPSPPNPVALRDGVRVFDVFFDEQVTAFDTGNEPEPGHRVLFGDVFRDGQFPARVAKAMMLIATADRDGKMWLPFESLEAAEEHIKGVINRMS